jgi:hypothetical protein
MRVACEFLGCFAGSGGGSSGPARRAFESPIAIASFVISVIRATDIFLFLPWWWLIVSLRG